ncbi:MAG: WG repeat-containing protein, partial [Bacteroidales bacterium]|nr:WG repeat-containing protein [Bacteroidales bacterium]
MKKTLLAFFVVITAITVPLANMFAQSTAMFPIDVGGDWGFMDKTGNVVIEPQFTEAGDFSEGLAKVSVDWKWGYIDQTGKFVIKP